MTCSLTDFNQACDIVTKNPDRRMGPVLLRAAVRCVVVHRPLADTVTIELTDGTRLDEVAIEALYEIASGACLVGAFQTGSRSSSREDRLDAAR